MCDGISIYLRPLVLKEHRQSDAKNLVCTSYSRQSSQYDCSTAVKAPQGHKTDGANKTEEHDLAVIQPTELTTSPESQRTHRT